MNRWVRAGFTIALGAVMASGLLAAAGPGWAPKRPSKEFLRAAKVLKPMPAAEKAYAHAYLPDWELFGSLDDRQTAVFVKLTRFSVPLSAMTQRNQDLEQWFQGGKRIGKSFVWYGHRVSLPVSSLTKRQRQCFDAVVKAWPDSDAHGRRDLLAQLRGLKAEPDLSNVEVGFSALGRVVSVVFEVEEGEGASHVVSGGIGLL